jgi:hypothetical protein
MRDKKLAPVDRIVELGWATKAQGVIIAAAYGSGRFGEAGMHTVELLDLGLDLLSRLGYQLRQEYLGGNGGGGCVLKGKKIFFLDLALDPGEQLDSVIDAVRRDPDALNLPMPHELRELLAVRKSA